MACTQMDAYTRSGEIMNSKTEIMAALHISTEELVIDRARVIEKCFCAASFNQGTTIASKLFADFLTLRNTLYSKKGSINKDKEIKLILKNIGHKDSNMLTISMLDECHKMLDEVQKKLLAIAQDMSGVKDD